MRSKSSADVAVFLLALAGISALLSGVIYLINQRSIENLIVSSAKSTSLAWADYFHRNIDDISAITQGEKPSRKSLNVIAEVRSMGDVFKFNLFTPDGVKVLDSDRLEEAGRRGESLGEHNPEALAAIKNGEPFVEVDERATPAGRRLVAETYVPVISNGRLMAIVEVYVDQTRNEALFRTAFSYNSVLIALLGGLGFAIPAVGFYRRTREKLQADAQADFLATHDLLTELPNRASFAELLARKLADDRMHGRLTAVHFIDIDHFKEVNDRFGSEAGDELLRNVSMRLGDLRGERDVAARLGADEFALAQFGLESEAEIEAASDLVKTALNVPYRLPDRQASVTFSIGTAVAPADGRTAEDLVKNAGTAVTVLKGRGGNGHCRFEPAYDAELQKRLQLEALVREATEDKRFELYFQPLFAISSAKLKGFEALLRLRDESGRFVPPDVFIPIAEEIGLIDDIGTWVLEKACMTAASWPEDAKISVNLSAAQFRRHSVCTSTREALDKSGLDPRRLYLEITESLLLAGSEQVLEQLAELKTMGVSIVMDDFGSGYSSLGYMLKFPFDRIKIDRSFIAGLNANDANSRNVVETIITLGHTLKMPVTAEGVETLSQAHALREMNCDDAQGYLFGRPVPATEVAAIFMRQFAGEMKRKEEKAVPKASAAGARRQ
jgi:diguanylate cyclase (GGDEF)-like protein